MPCYDARDHDTGAAREEGREQARRDAVHNSVPAELLCWTMQNMDLSDRASLLSANKELAKWWRDHQERDRLKAIREREAREKKQHNEAIDRQIKALQRKRK